MKSRYQQYADQLQREVIRLGEIAPACTALLGEIDDELAVQLDPTVRKRLEWYQLQLHATRQHGGDVSPDSVRVVHDELARVAAEREGVRA